MGIERTRGRLKEAEVVLAVAEATDRAEDIAEFARSLAELSGDSGVKIILAINKSDLAGSGEITRLNKELRRLCDLPAVFISAVTASGMDELKMVLTASVETGRLDAPQYIVTNARHYEALTNVSESLQRVLNGFRDGIPTVLIATDVRQAVYHLGLITGKITPEDILGQIFSKFCIGK